MQGYSLSKMSGAMRFRLYKVAPLELNSLFFVDGGSLRSVKYV